MLPATLICGWVYSEMKMYLWMQKERLEGFFPLLLAPDFSFCLALTLILCVCQAVLTL